MQKILKILLVVILGIIGTCSLIWVLSTTASGFEEASARGEALGTSLALFCSPPSARQFSNWFEVNDGFK